MKKIKSLLLILACSSTVLLSGQNVPSGISSSEWARQNPDKVLNASPADAGQLKNRGNSVNQMRNGVTYTYVGSFRVSDGGNWGTNPPCYTGQEAAALLFGGTPEDYAISTNPNNTDPNTITFTAWLDGWGETITEYAQDYKVDLPPPGYYEPFGIGAARSAYVNDHDDYSYVNYVWRVSGGAPAVPLSNWALYLGIFLIVMFTAIHFRKMV